MMRSLTEHNRIAKETSFRSEHGCLRNVCIPHLVTMITF